MRDKINEILLRFILGRIEKADDYQINEIIHAVVRRYSLVYPDWNVVFLSLPVDQDEREKQLDQTIEFIKNYV